MALYILDVHGVHYRQIAMFSLLLHLLNYYYLGEQLNCTRNGHTEHFIAVIMSVFLISSIFVFFWGF